MSKRLKLIADQIKKEERVLDVGTDHGLLPIILIENNITNNITASDLNIGPLEAAKTNLTEKGLLDKVKLVLTDGLKDIEPSDYDVIVIAGMGATTISNIISSKEFNGRFIIHSTTHVDDVRKAIYSIGHIITNEWVDKEGKIYNVIIETKPGKGELSEKEIYLGPSLMKKEEYKSYYQFLLDVLEKNVSDSGIEDLKIKERKWLKEILWNE